MPKLKEYNVRATVTIELDIDVKASSEDKAEELVRNNLNASISLDVADHNVNSDVIQDVEVDSVDELE